MNFNAEMYKFNDFSKKYPIPNCGILSEPNLKCSSFEKHIVSAMLQTSQYLILNPNPEKTKYSIVIISLCKNVSMEIKVINPLVYDMTINEDDDSEENRAIIIDKIKNYCYDAVIDDEVISFSYIQDTVYNVVPAELANDEIGKLIYSPSAYPEDMRRKCVVIKIFSKLSKTYFDVFAPYNINNSKVNYEILIIKNGSDLF